MKTKILYVIDDLMIGGAEKVLFELVANLDRDRFSTEVVTLFSCSGMGAEFSRIGVPCRNLSLRKLTLLRVILNLRRMMRSGDYDIVQLIRPLSRILGMTAAAGLSDPKIVARYDSMVSWETPRYRMFERPVIRRANTIIVPSHAVAEDLKRFHPFSREKLLVAYNGIENCASNPDTGLRKGARLTIGTIGNIGPKKGYVNAIKALSKLVNSVPNIKYEVIGRDNGGGKLRSLVREHGLENTIDFLGEKKDVAPFLHRWDVYFQPSLTEGFGMALLEAMVYCKPIVATRVGGVPELIEDHVSGLLVDSGDIDGMAGRLHDLLGDPEKARKLGERAGLAAAEQFTSRKMTEDHQKLYTALAKKPTTRGAPR